MPIFLDENGEEKNKILEISPSGRFKRFNDILGEGSSETVYRGIDLSNNKSIAWNIISAINLTQKNKEERTKKLPKEKNEERKVNLLHFNSFFQACVIILIWLKNT